MDKENENENINISEEEEDIDIDIATKLNIKTPKIDAKTKTISKSKENEENTNSKQKTKPESSKSKPKSKSKAKPKSSKSKLKSSKSRSKSKSKATTKSKNKSNGNNNNDNNDNNIKKNKNKSKNGRKTSLKTMLEKEDKLKKNQSKKDESNLNESKDGSDDDTNNNNNNNNNNNDDNNNNNNNNENNENCSKIEPVRCTSIELEETAVEDIVEFTLDNPNFDLLSKEMLQNMKNRDIKILFSKLNEQISNAEYDVFGLECNYDYDSESDGNKVNLDEKTKEFKLKMKQFDTKEAILRRLSKRKQWICPKYAVPIRADIKKFDFDGLAEMQIKYSVDSRLFDVIMMDPPWQLASSNPTRGVALGYAQLQDDIILGLPVTKLQKNGFLFIWVINAKYRLAVKMMHHWGYKIVSDIAWVKQSVNRRVQNGHGFYLQHAKETCLVGYKGSMEYINKLTDLASITDGVCSDVIYSERRGQSQKPREIYEYVERLVPNGYYLEIFGRRNNLRNGWVTIGNEL